VDALAPLGVRHIDMPIRRERVFELLRKARTAPAGRKSR
jgi:hypothetical protein